MLKTPDPANPARRRAVVATAALAGGAFAVGDLRAYLALAQDDIAVKASGYGRDPNLMAPKRQPWPKVLSATQRSTLARLMDVVLPPSPAHPAPSALGLVDFFEEWLSAPYPDQIADRALLSPLIDAFNPIADASGVALALQRLEATPRWRVACQRMVQLIAGAYYTTPEGAALIGFVGNQPSTDFAGPPGGVISALRAKADILPLGSTDS